MENTQNWYIVKGNSGICQIIAVEAGKTPETSEYWGPLSSEEEAIARRVGLIRSGKCQPL